MLLWTRVIQSRIRLIFGFRLYLLSIDITVKFLFHSYRLRSFFLRVGMQDILTIHGILTIIGIPDIQKILGNLDIIDIHDILPWETWPSIFDNNPSYIRQPTK